MPNPQQQTVTHPLLSREIRPIKNWCEWLDRWQTTTTFQEMMGLLHTGFNLTTESYGYGETKFSQVDRIIFYFGIADGWDDHWSFESPGKDKDRYEVGYDEHGNTVRKTVGELRQELARKAFDMLCVNFFNMKLYQDIHIRDFGWLWTEQVLSNQLFLVIRNFFRVKENIGDRVEIYNLSHNWDGKSHNEKLAIGFLLNLTQFLWKWRKPDISSYSRGDKVQCEERYASIQLAADSAKPWMIEVLAHLKQLDMLREWILDFDKPCLDKLKEIALGNKLWKVEHHVTKERKVASIDEACFTGSPAAWLLKEYELKKRETKRLEEILEAENAKEEADRKLRKLTSK